MCVPLMTAYYQGNVIISEQRSNRVTIINYKTKEILDYLGRSKDVGCIGDFLWSPQAVIIGNYMYIVMCKGCNIFIRRYCCSTHRWDVFFGNPLFSYSYLNFPRGCDYSKQNELLAVADTYHDQVVLFNLDGSIYKIIGPTLIEDLHWPRCVKWVGKDLYIVNSTLCEVLKANDDFSSFQKIDLPKIFIPQNQWMQAFNLYNNTMLLAFERQVFLWDVETKQLLWNSIERLGLCDVHFTQLINEKCILITDTGNDRVLFVDHEHIRTISHVYYARKRLSFNTPRLSLLMGKELIILDSGNSRIIICNFYTLEVTHIYGGCRGWEKNKLSKPRWICAGPDGHFFISDTDNHRILLADIIHD